MPSPGRGSSLRAAVSTVEGGCVMCSVGGVWGELVCTGMSSDWRLPSTWFWVGVFWRSEQKAVTKCKHKSQDCLKVLRRQHEATLAGKAAALTHTFIHTLTPAGARAHTRWRGLRPEDTAPPAAYLEEEIAPSSIHFAA